MNQLGNVIKHPLQY